MNFIQYGFITKETDKDSVNTIIDIVFNWTVSTGVHKPTSNIWIQYGFITKEADINTENTIINLISGYTTAGSAIVKKYKPIIYIN